jgi:hypothetical protein
MGNFTRNQSGFFILVELFEEFVTVEVSTIIFLKMIEWLCCMPPCFHNTKRNSK